MYVKDTRSKKFFISELRAEGKWTGTRIGTWLFWERERERELYICGIWYMIYMYVMCECKWCCLTKCGTSCAWFKWLMYDCSDAWIVLFDYLVWMITCFLGLRLFSCICCACNVVYVVDCYRMCKQREKIVTGWERSYSIHLYKSLFEAWT